MKKAIGIAVRLTIIAILFSLVLNHDRQDARGAGTKQGRDGFAISSNGEVINYLPWHWN